MVEHMHSLCHVLGKKDGGVAYYLMRYRKSDFGGAGDFAFPSDDAYAHVEEEVRSTTERPTDDVFAPSADPNATPSVDVASRKGKSKLDTTEGPPKKKERRIKTEADIKVEPVDTE
ncbi:unnamed protein product [Heligmosomoides polygyrus]|uniref:Chromo domain-containing protein n=1 Tax=Heligmosomoides polygyrus TaxID=6339 RepID=A0A183FC98_HELPZ|nr:unnamed protein product [Heligmosomoides polygyrus]